MWERRGGEVPEAWYRLPIFYFSNVSEIRGPDEPVWSPAASSELDYELEVAALVDTPARDLAADRAEEAIGGYTIFNDWSARDLQREETTVRLGPAKGKDFASSFGPWLVTPDELADARSAGATGPDLAMTAEVNGVGDVARAAGPTPSSASARCSPARRPMSGSGPATSSGRGRSGRAACSRFARRRLAATSQPGDEVTLRVERLGELRTPDRRAAAMSDAATARAGTADLTFPPLPAGLDTPCLVVDLDRVAANIARLAAETDRRGVALRPHMQDPQERRDSPGCSSTPERPASRSGRSVRPRCSPPPGSTDIFLAYPVWADGPKAARIAGAPRAPRRRSGSASTRWKAPRLSRPRSTASPTPLRVLVEVDPGLHRTGLASPDGRRRGRRGRPRRGPRGRGRVHPRRARLPDPDAPRRARPPTRSGRSARPRPLSRATASPFETISAGSTPTMLTAAGGQVNEIRAGTYVSATGQQWLLGAIPGRRLRARRRGDRRRGPSRSRIVLDAGAKALTKDRATWLVGSARSPAYPDARDRAAVNDYHGIVTAPAGVDAARARRGRRDRPEPRLPGRGSLRHVRRRHGRRGCWAVAGRRARAKRLDGRSRGPRTILIEEMTPD